MMGICFNHTSDEEHACLKENANVTTETEEEEDSDSIQGILPESSDQQAGMKNMKNECCTPTQYQSLSVTL